MLPWTFGNRVSRTAQATGVLAIAQLRLKSPKPSLEGRPPLAIALGLDALVIRNHREKHPPAIPALSLAIRTAEQPDPILMHRTVVGPEPVDQRVNIELCRLAAHRMPAVDIDGFVGGQCIWRGCEARRSPLKGSPQRRRRWQANVGATESVSFYTISNCWTRAMRR